MAATELSLPENFHENSLIREVHLSDIKIDRSYQREPSQKLVDEIAANWNLVASELVLVSDRGAGRESQWKEEGRFYLVNGQHRTLAARKLNHETIWARVVDLSKETDPGAVEADFRLLLNVKLGDKSLERFKAQVRAGDEDSINIVKLLARFDTEINVSPNPESGINCIAAIESIYAPDKGGLLAETLEVIKDAYGGFYGRAVSAATFKGIAWFILKHADTTDRDRLVDKLKIAGTEALHRKSVTMQSTMGGSLWMNYYRTLVEFYNERLVDKNRLEWQLRGAGSTFVKGGGESSAGRSGEGGYTAS